MVSLCFLPDVERGLEVLRWIDCVEVFSGWVTNVRTYTCVAEVRKVTMFCRRWTQKKKEI